MKQNRDILERACCNAPKAEGSKVPKRPKEQMAAIEEALRHFEVLP